MPSLPSGPSAGLPEIGIDRMGIHAITLGECVRRIRDRLGHKFGGWAAPINLERFQESSSQDGVRAQFDQADIRFADSRTLVWASRLQRTPLPERISGTDLFRELCRAAAEENHRVFLLGGAQEMLGLAEDNLRAAIPGITVVGSRPLAWDEVLSTSARIELAQQLKECNPNIIFLGLGARAQASVVGSVAGEFPASWWVGVGSALRLAATEEDPSPRWMRAIGAEWVYWLFRYPGELWRSYLFQAGPFAAGLLVRSLWRGSIPRGRAARARAPKALLLDDDPFSLDYLELVLGGRFPTLQMERRESPDPSGVYDVFFVDNDFHGELLAARIVPRIRRQNPDALVFAFSGTLDVDSLKSLINVGCDGVCDKSDPSSWETALSMVKGRIELVAASTDEEGEYFGGVRRAAESILELLRGWNNRGKIEKTGGKV